MKTKLIIIGALRSDKRINDDDNDYTEWNNPNQANYTALVKLVEDIDNIEILCIDPFYPNIDTSASIIQFIKDRYTINDTKFFDINAHNIVVEFSNILNENWCCISNENCVYDKEYKISWLACGCSWQDGLPIKTIKSVITNKLYTPFDSTNVDSYLTTINYNNSINNSDMIPFFQGIYQALGTLMYRGNSNNYTTEKPLRELFKLIGIPSEIEEKEKFKNFIDEQIHWNLLSRNTRLYMTKFIYGDFILIT